MVILIIGILAAFAIPPYMKTVETSKADDAVAPMNMIGTTNRMFALDHPSALNSGWVSGQLTTSCGTTYGACGTTAGSPCELVACKYLAAQDFDSMAYQVSADIPSAQVACNAGQYTTDAMACPGAACSACVARKISPAVGGTNIPPYTTWAYGISTSGQMSSSAGAPGAVSP